MIRRTGPGKYDTVLDSLVHEMSMEGIVDDTAGDVSEQGLWAGLIYRPGDLVTDIEKIDGDLTDDERSLLKDSAGVIIVENDQGFVVVNYFDDKAELDTEWKKISDELAADETESDESDSDDVQANEALHECAPNSSCQAVHRGKKLTQAQRDALPASKFAIPSRRAYPIPNAYHATLALTALARTAARSGKKPTDARKVIAAVRKKFPAVADCECNLIDRVKRAHGV